MQHWKPGLPTEQAGTLRGPLILTEEEGLAVHQHHRTASQGVGHYDSTSENSIPASTGTLRAGRQTAENQSDQEELHAPQSSSAMRRTVEEEADESTWTTPGPLHSSLPAEHVTAVTSVERSEEVDRTRLGKTPESPAPSTNPFVSVHTQRAPPPVQPSVVEQRAGPRTLGG